MFHAPASDNPYALLGPGQVIRLFLSRLLSCLLRLEASGEVVPTDIAYMVASADGIVPAFVRMRAAEQLECAGLTDAACAMRLPHNARQIRAPQIDVEAASPAHFIARVNSLKEQFDRADALAARLAVIILCALTLVLPKPGRTPIYWRGVVSVVNCSLFAIGHAPLWPPPFGEGLCVSTPEIRLTG
ncbi:MAG: hypothetical protein CMK07_14560 [Ponticaulis sp.]|nr:hypothetical protein [Ponticaulis sp.]